MVHIYNEYLEYLIGLNYDYEDFKKNPTLYYPAWTANYYASPTKYEYPIITEEGIIREMTREEKIIKLSMKDLLNDGEYLENGEIKTIKAPESIIRAAWNRETCQWHETMTKEELLEKRSQKIIEYSKLEEEKKVLENSRFSTTDEIQLVASKMANVEMEINSLASQIEILEA